MPPRSLLKSGLTLRACQPAQGKTRLPDAPFKAFHTPISFARFQGIGEVRCTAVLDPAVDGGVRLAKPPGDLRSAETPGFLDGLQPLAKFSHAFGTIFIPIWLSMATSSGFGAVPGLMPN